jgi:hypothetical protein
MMTKLWHKVYTTDSTRFPCLLFHLLNFHRSANAKLQITPFSTNDIVFPVFGLSLIFLITSGIEFLKNFKIQRNPIANLLKGI